MACFTYICSYLSVLLYHLPFRDIQHVEIISFDFMDPAGLILKCIHSTASYRFDLKITSLVRIVGQRIVNFDHLDEEISSLQEGRFMNWF